jgi:AcrR family transcriptional regulator
MARTTTISDEALLADVRHVFVAEGPAVSTREIARRVGVSEGVLFQRYSTKQELFFAAMVLPAVDVVRLFAAQRKTGRAHLLQITMALTDYFRQLMPVLLPLMTHAGFRFEEFAQRHPGSPLDSLRRGLVDFFVRERRAGRVGPVDVGGAALCVLSLAQTTAFFERMGAHDGHFPPKLLANSVRTLWAGMAPHRRGPVRARAAKS